MKRHLAAAVLLLGWSSLHARQRPPATGPAPPLSLNAYVVELNQWTEAAAELRDHPEKAADFRKTAPDKWLVSMGGQKYQVPVDWLRDDFEAAEKDPASAGEESLAIQSRLSTMRAAAQALAEPAGVDPALARGRLDDILKTKEFRGIHKRSWVDEVRDRVTAWINDALDRLLGRMSGHPDVQKALLWSLVVTLIIFLFLMLGRSFFRPREGIRLDLKSALPPKRAWKDWARDALAMAGRGDYREAIRLGYWAGIYRLEELDVWRVDGARTHREYLRMLSAQDSHRPALAAVTQRFETAWYGGDSASAVDFEFVIRQLEGLGCNISLRPPIATS